MNLGAGAAARGGNCFEPAFMIKTRVYRLHVQASSFGIINRMILTIIRAYASTLYKDIGQRAPGFDGGGRDVTGEVSMILLQRLS